MVIYLDHATLLRLSKPALRVIVGNPSIADVNVDSPQLITVFGKMAGETNLIILGDNDQTLLSRPLIVINAQDHAVAVHVPGKDGPISRVYSCIDGHCLRIRSPSDAATSANVAAPRPMSEQNGAVKTDGAANSGNPTP
jgi:Flp pilus assembly secretin CpaC